MFVKPKNGSHVLHPTDNRELEPAGEIVEGNEQFWLRREAAGEVEILAEPPVPIEAAKPAKPAGEK